MFIFTGCLYFFTMQFVGQSFNSTFLVLMPSLIFVFVLFTGLLDLCDFSHGHYFFQLLHVPILYGDLSSRWFLHSDSLQRVYPYRFYLFVIIYGITSGFVLVDYHHRDLSLLLAMVWACTMCELSTQPPSCSVYIPLWSVVTWSSCILALHPAWRLSGQHYLGLCIVYSAWPWGSLLWSV